MPARRAEPPADHAALERRREPGQSGAIEGAVSLEPPPRAGGQAVEKLLVLSGDVGEASERLLDARMKAPLEQRQELAADAIAREASLGVGAIGAMGEAAAAQELQDFFPRHVEQRAYHRI